MATVRAMRLRVYPTPSQAAMIDKIIDDTRYVYNHMLERNTKMYRRRKEHLSYYDMQNLLPVMKGYKAWLAESDSQALKYACRQLDNAFKKFFAKQGGYPNYKSRRDGRQSYTTTNAAHIHYLDRRVRIPKIGILKVRDSRRLPPGAKICYATVIRDHGIYFASITYKAEEEAPPAAVSESAVLGLDYKSDGLYVDSNGVSAGMDHFYRKSQKALARQQRKLSGKVGARKGEKPSGNFKRQQKRVQKLFRHVANQRSHFLHNKSLAIAKEYDAVCVETLNMRNMANKGFGNGKATLDNEYGMFLWMLEYKLAERGKVLVKADKFFPSSQLCSCCGARNPALKDLTIRRWTCTCGAEHDRDVNAARNIRKEGIRVLKSMSRLA